MTVGVVGLGLIGGSMARAYSRAGHTVYGGDIDKSVESYARLCGVTDGALEEHLGECDIVFIALPPEAALEFLRENGGRIRAGAFVVDTCGVKRRLCEACFALAAEHGFRFVGGHPMAGTQHSGFKHSREDLFDGAVMLIVPRAGEDVAALGKLCEILKIAGFSSVTTTNAEEHDRMIAFTSQLAHVVSNAYVKSPTAAAHHRFSAGSYRDLTRVARLNEDMWSELFIDNADNLCFELDNIIAALSQYRVAIAEGDRERLRSLLREGRERKEAIDG